jgi:DNA-binding CsgD family transcriptional regulator
MLDFLRWHRRQLGPLNADKSLRILRDETDLTDLRVVDVRPGPFEQAARREEWRIVSRAADAKGRNVLRWTREGYARTAIAARLGLSETRVSQVTARLVALARRAIGAAA